MALGPGLTYPQLGNNPYKTLGHTGSHEFPFFCTAVLILERQCEMVRVVL